MDAKKLLIVCDRDGKAGAQLLASLINAEGTVRGVPDPVNASVMDLYDWARVKPSDGYTLFFGDSDDLLLASDGIPFSFQHLGLRYGFIGTRALASVSLTDNVLNNYKDFLWYYRSVFPEARDLFASDAKGNSSLFDFIVPMVRGDFHGYHQDAPFPRRRHRPEVRVPGESPAENPAR